MCSCLFVVRLLAVEEEFCQLSELPKHNGTDFYLERQNSPLKAPCRIIKLFSLGLRLVPFMSEQAQYIFFPHSFVKSYSFLGSEEREQLNIVSIILSSYTFQFSAC